MGLAVMGMDTVHLRGVVSDEGRAILMAEESTTGAIALGLVVASVGIFAIDHAMSDPGKSWFDQIKSKLSSKGEEPHVLPPERSSRFPAATPPADERRAPPVRRGALTHPPIQIGPPRAPRTPIARAPIARLPATPPQTISPEMVKEAARRLNAVFGTNFRVDGITTTEMQRTIKSVQQQFGWSPTGFPDAKLLAQLGRIMRDAAQPGVVTDAAKVISKTFGGPPSTPATGPDEGVKKTQQMLNSYFKNHVLSEDGYLGPLTTGAIKEFQKAEGLQDTGSMDDKTHDLLVKRANDGAPWLSHKTGAAGGNDWKAETQSLPQFSQDVLGKIVSSETNPRTLKSVGKILGAAGYPKTAAAVLAKAGGASATSGFFPDPYYGYYPLLYGPWWTAYGPYGWG